MAHLFFCYCICMWMICLVQQRVVNKLKVLLSREFDMKDLGATKKILGMEIRRDRDAKRLWLSQANYVKKVLERFSMENAKPVSTPLANHFRLSTSQ